MTAGPVALALQSKLIKDLAPLHLELINESHMHSRGEAESHFRLVLVSAQFSDLPRIDRSRRVHELLAEELKSSVHALSLVLFSPEEWEKRSGEKLRASPPCHSQKDD